VTPPAPPNAPPETSLLAPSELPVILLGRLRLLIALPLILFAIGLAKITLGAPRYRADSRVRASSSDGGAGRLANIAAQFGFALPTGGGGDPVKLYVEMLGSQQILRQALTSPYAVPRVVGSADSVRGTLLDILDITGADSVERLKEGVQRLRNLMEITTNEAAAVIRLRVTTEWPLLSEAVNRRILEVVNEAMSNVRRMQAGGERQFVEGRMVSAQNELLEAEAVVQRFRERNRQYANSPELTTELERLQRRVLLRQQVFSALAQAYEQARIDEVRNTPVLVILDPPEMTATKVGRKRDAIMWFIVGAVLAVFIAVGQEALHRQRLRNPQWWSTLAASLRAGIRSLAFRRQAPS